RILQSHHAAAQRVAPGAGSRTRQGNANSDRQVGWGLLMAHGRKQDARGFKLPVFGLAGLTLVQMPGDFMHLHAADGAIKIRRKQRPCLSAIHGWVSSSPCPVPIWVAPLRSELISFTNFSSRLRRASRPRIRRDFTVPSEICKTSAISS